MAKLAGITRSDCSPEENLVVSKPLGLPVQSG
jgi:hypothetical protein